MPRFKKLALDALNYTLNLLKWLALAVLVGGVCGAIGALFHYAVDAATEAREKTDWILFLLPVAGLAIVAIYRAFRVSPSVGTDKIFESTREKTPVPAHIAPLIFISTFLTHLFGGSSGREGAALQLGGGIASDIGKAIKLNKREMQTIELAGMSALFSALFGTPAAAAIFVLEVVDVGVMEYQALFPCILASVSAYLVAGKLGVTATRFTLPTGALAFELTSFLQIMALAALCALVAILFCAAMHYSAHCAQKLIPNDYARIFVGGALVVGLTLVLGTRDYNGAGMHVVASAIGGNARPEAWILKLALTAVTLSVGFKGGEIVPSFFVGACFGCVAGSLIGLDPCVSAALGLIGVFCGVTNTPAASILLAVEMFGGEYLIPFAVTVGVSYLISGKCSLYHSQSFYITKLAWRTGD